MSTLYTMVITEPDGAISIRQAIGTSVQAAISHMTYPAQLIQGFLADELIGVDKTVHVWSSVARSEAGTYVMYVVLTKGAVS